MKVIFFGHGPLFGYENCKVSVVPVSDCMGTHDEDTNNEAEKLRYCFISFVV
jgi:hypothetical protein